MASRTNSRQRANLSARKEEIRGWVEEGHTDSQIASWLGTSQNSVQSFRSRHGIHRPSPGGKDRRNRGEEYASFEGVLEHPPPTRKGKKRAKGIWLDPAVADTDVWTSGWSGVREVRVRIGEDSITVEAKPTEERF